MAERLSNVVRPPFQSQRDLKDKLPQNPEDEHWRMEGLEPSVQVFEGATEQKMAPNYSDYLTLKEDEYNRTLSRRTEPPDVMDILHEANLEV